MGIFERDDALHLLFIRKPDDDRTHPGQVAFPGGKLDRGEEPLTAALREAEEELALARQHVEPLGTLSDILVTTGFSMTPFVGKIPPAEALDLQPNPREVARVFSVPILALVDPAQTRFELKPKGFMGRIYQIPYFHWGDAAGAGELIWGATGKVVQELLELLDLM